MIHHWSKAKEGCEGEGMGIGEGGGKVENNHSSLKEFTGEEKLERG